jgi:hypothetical protein
VTHCAGLGSSSSVCDGTRAHTGTNTRGIPVRWGGDVSPRKRTRTVPVGPRLDGVGCHVFCERRGKAKRGAILTAIGACSIFKHQQSIARHEKKATTTTFLPALGLPACAGSRPDRGTPFISDNGGAAHPRRGRFGRLGRALPSMSPPLTTGSHETGRRCSRRWQQRRLTLGGSAVCVTGKTSSES